MKIVLKFYGNRYQQRPGETIDSFIRTAFAHISHKVWIKSISIANAAKGTSPHDFDLVEIETKPQGSEIENQQMVKMVKEAISLRGQLEIVSIGEQRTLQEEAIKAVGENTYKVNLGFASFVARNDRYRQELATKNVTSAKCEYVNVEGDTYASTGKISTESKMGEDEFDPTNIYNCFAIALSESREFREKIAESDLLELILRMNTQTPQNPKSALIISLVERNNYRFFLPQPTQQAKADSFVDPDLLAAALATKM